MKKLTFLETTVPVGAECLYPTEQEVKNFFQDQLLTGEITLGIGYTDHMEKDLVWLLQTPQGDYFPLWAFRRNNSISGNLSYFYPEDAGKHFLRNRRTYLLCQDETLGLSIREQAVFSEEKDIKALFQMMKKPFEEISLVGVYLTPEEQTPSFTSWLVTNKNNYAQMYPTFTEDILIHRGFNPNRTAWNYLEIGDIFYHFNEKYQVGYDLATGWYFSKIFHNPHMKISMVAI